MKWTYIYHFSCYGTEGNYTDGIMKGLTPIQSFEDYQDFKKNLVKEGLVKGEFTITSLSLLEVIHEEQGE